MSTSHSTTARGSSTPLRASPTSSTSTTVSKGTSTHMTTRTPRPTSSATSQTTKTSTTPTKTGTTTHTESFSFAPAPTIVPNGACKNPPTCDQCIDGFQFRCRPNPNGDGGQVCWCEWESGCVGEYRYGDCATLDCTVYPFGGPRQSFHCDTTFNDGEYTGMYPDGLCYCRDTPCRAEKCPDLNCTATHGYGWQAVCDPSMEE
ncbi:hypothetical protein PG988_004619 [Apiospora saccharicola]